MSEDDRKVGENTPVKNTGNMGKGRVKGVPNKSTKAVKEALQEAFENLGGVPALAAWAAENPTEFYKLWTKLIPTEVKAELTMPQGYPVGKVQIEVIGADAKNPGN